MATRIEEIVQQKQPYWESFWKGDVPMLSAVLPKDPANPVDKPKLGITHKTDIDALADHLLEWARTNAFLGGAIPFYCIYIFDVYSVTGALMGAEVRASGNSHSMVPFLDELDPDKIQLHPDGPVADRIRSIAARLKERCGEELLIFGNSINGNLDALEAIRGNSRLLMDLYDNPDGVHSCLDACDRVVAEILDMYADIYEFEKFGCICRHGMYNRGKVSVPQCDFGYMISPDHFEEFAYPYLAREFERLDGVCYHLDGIGNLPNLELLCSDPNLHIIQWVPGAGKSREDWTHVYEKTNKLGRGCMRSGSIQSFESWYENHKAPFEYWNIKTDSADEFNKCLEKYAPGLSGETA